MTRPCRSLISLSHNVFNALQSRAFFEKRSVPDVIRTILDESLNTKEEQTERKKYTKRRIEGMLAEVFAESAVKTEKNVVVEPPPIANLDIERARQ